MIRIAVHIVHTALIIKRIVATSDMAEIPDAVPFLQHTLAIISLLVAVEVIIIMIVIVISMFQFLYHVVPAVALVVKVAAV